MSTVVTPSADGRGELTLIGAMLGEPGDLSACRPGPGRPHAFAVDLDRCSGCKTCVAAGHSLNGPDEFEARCEVGLIVGAVAGLLGELAERFLVFATMVRPDRPGGLAS